MITLFSAGAQAFDQENQPNMEAKRIGLVIHGGAGTIERSKMTPERKKAYRDKLTEALLAGFGVLKSGGQCLDAVVAAITLLEDSPLFNAGKGAVFTSAGTNELDSSIMEGKTLRAGSVGCSTRSKCCERISRAMAGYSAVRTTVYFMRPVFAP